MEEFDDHLPGRRFDNFQFVDFHLCTKETRNSEAVFALSALMEVPNQFQNMVELGYFSGHHEPPQEDPECVPAFNERRID